MNRFRWTLAAVLLASATLHAEVPASKKISVLVLMFNGVQVIDFAGPYEVFGQAGFDVHTVSRDGKPVQTAMNLNVNVDYDFASAPVADVVVVPGGEVDATSKDATTLAWIARNAGSAQQVLSICTGSDILAATGLLDGRSATTFHKHFDHMAERFPKVQIVRDQRWVDAGKLVTSAGLASGIDAALHVVARLRDVEAARSVALHLEYDWSPTTGFVRGVLADQFMRMPAQAVQFPDGTEFKQVRSIGDSKHWETDYRVSSSLTPSALIAYLRQLAQKDKALQVLASTDARQVAWRYEATRGGRWRLSFEAFDEPADGHYRVVAKVIKL